MTWNLHNPWKELTHHSACQGNVDWEPAWHAHSPASLWRCACTGPGGWMEAWWRTSGRHPQNSHTEFGGGSGSQMPDGPAVEQTHNNRTRPKHEPWPNSTQLLFKICEVLTVLMLTLMTGMRERQDDVGSGLSALMFTLKKGPQDIQLHYSLEFISLYCKWERQ